MNTRTLNDGWIRIIGIPLIFILLYFMDEDAEIWMGFVPSFIRAVRLLIYTWLYWEIMRFILLKMRKKFPEISETPRRIIIQISILPVIVAAVSVVICLSKYLYLQVEEPFIESFRETYAKSLSLCSVVMLIYEAFYFFNRWKMSMYESERLKNEHLLSQLDILKNQISPHFLFNSLNTMITLVPEDPELAVEFIQRLSNVYRHVLQYTDRNVIDFADELAFVKDYVFLNQIRFGKNLEVTYELSDDNEAIRIVPFALQMLVENAIKHNIISMRKPLHIVISQNQNFIIVRNNLQKKTSGILSTGVGLENIRSRYQVLTGSLVEVIETSAEFFVFLPLISPEVICRQ